LLRSVACFSVRKGRGLAGIYNDLHMPATTTAKTRLILTWVLRILLGVMFLGIGIEKLTGTMGTIPFFAAVGWGQWFRYTSGVFDLAGALLILIPRWTSLGAAIITCTVGLGAYLCFTKDLFNPLFPLTMTLLAALLVWLAWRPKPA
jgi:putative oxidoreductase